MPECFGRDAVLYIAYIHHIIVKEIVVSIQSLPNIDSRLMNLCLCWDRVSEIRESIPRSIIAHFL